MARRRWVVAAVVGALVTAGGIAAIVWTTPGSPEALGHPSPTASDPARPTTSRPEPPADVDVDVERVREHLEALQAVADANGGNRSVPSAGYDASADYVAGVLRDAGYEPRFQDVLLPAWMDGSSLSVVAPEPRTFLNGADFVGNDLDGAGRTEATGVVVPVDLGLADLSSTTSACEPEDFAGFPAGSVALVRRGGCGDVEKARNAAAAGAVGVLVMNQGTPGREDVFDMIGDAEGLAIPVLSVAARIGLDLAASPDVSVHLVEDGAGGPVVSRNVIAETAGGTDDVVLVGAHLDSVVSGPGMNDNASGAAAVLALAEELADADLGATVRFVWWTGEEIGLLGSQAYVDLPPTQEDDLDRVVAYLNADMIASPNAVVTVYDGGTDLEALGLPGPSGTAEVAPLLDAVLTDQGVPHETGSLDGASDHLPFALAGVPSGGVTSGAGDPVSAAQVELFEGLAGVAPDLCYHQACDSLTPAVVPPEYAGLDRASSLLGNIDLTVLDAIVDALGTAVVRLAADPGLVRTTG